MVADGPTSTTGQTEGYRMHIFFSGIGGVGIGPLALIALKAGHQVSGSDARPSRYLNSLAQRGIKDVSVGQEVSFIASVDARQPIDWFVYSSAVAIENPDSAEFTYCREHGIRMSRRDELLNHLIDDGSMKLIAIAGTHGKTTTTAMIVWLFQQLNLQSSYSVGGTLSFGDMGDFVAGSEYFIYEACEFDRNFLEFEPHLSVITGIDWDHPDTYPTRTEYEQAFRDFLDQSANRILWRSDQDRLGYGSTALVLIDEAIEPEIRLLGAVNRRNAQLAVTAVRLATNTPMSELVEHINRFPGVGRRFESITPGLYTDYAHTIAKIRGAIQVSQEAGGAAPVVVYEGLHNTRQHFMRDELSEVFDEVKKLYIVPSYLAREDATLEVLTPKQLKGLMSTRTRERTVATEMGAALSIIIAEHLAAGDIVLCISGGGVGSLDDWLRTEYGKSSLRLDAGRQPPVETTPPT
jgi:UDP-N-acetylmuramate--alanine ligase